jgi:putative acetyltransferase
MRSVAENIMSAEQLGYACVDRFTLPLPCWWDEYYEPLLRNIERLRAEAEHDDMLAAAIANASSEIDLFRRRNQEYGYVFYLLQKSEVSIEPGSQSDAQEIARVLRRSFSTALPFLPTLHTPDEELHYISEEILPKNDVYVARNETREIVGYIAFSDELINHLYLLPEYVHKGIGTRLLNIAKSRKSKLRLWTFQRNDIAKWFYTKHGFTIVQETDGSGNEEKEPDVLFEWSSNAGE